MLNVEQVRLLEERVQRVISRTGELQRENGDLRERLEGYQERIRELEAHIETFVSTQAEIEKGVLNALHQLDEVEDAVVEGVQEDRVVTSEEESDTVHEDEVQDSSTHGSAPTAGSAENEPADRETPEPSTKPEMQPDHVSEEAYAAADDEEPSGPELDIF